METGHNSDIRQEKQSMMNMTSETDWQRYQVDLELIMLHISMPEPMSKASPLGIEILWISHMMP
jgi:hypothetical protein